ncbi:MAG: hypothetical protein IJM76_02530 [Lachnospiraceae bacterium]|nr:hypothetical protein [Lachnospiraceae bacterium]
MESYAVQLKQQSQYFEELIRKAERRISSCTAPEDLKICVSNREKGFQYYRVDRDGKRRYLKKENMAMIAEVVQRDYDRAVLKKLVDARHQLECFLRHYDVNAAEEVYHKLCAARKVLVTPIVETEEEIIQKWKEEHVGGQNNYPAAGTYLTEQGEAVRSKSEKILADLFLKYGVPYVYEPTLRLQNGKVFYPDFMLLNVRKRKNVYWEHFGLISDGEYASKSLQKLREYDAGGLAVGKDILFSMESETMPLNLREVERKIKEHLI